ncbi:MAG: tyrosine-type recombinase/integrase [Actinomycetota bacterium]|nr:tyrosine-type recombinase/integrase [Actinomycetota bacterium]
MIESNEPSRDLSALVVRSVGGLQQSEDPFEPYRLLDGSGRVIAPAAAYLGDLQARGLSETTQRSYAMALLRWFRFLAAIDVAWDQATGAEARDFSRWIQIAAKPVRPHWRHQDESEESPAAERPGRTSGRMQAPPNPVTGTRPSGTRYAPATAAHSETVLRGFYQFHLEAGSGPMVNPFPLSRTRRGGRANAHHNPMEPFANERGGRYRPRLVQRIPRQIPDARFDELFAALGSHRDRALVALWISTGARASELLGVSCGDVDPGQQLITVVRKGSRALQQLPASSDAFVWLRLYQLQMQDLVPAGRDQPLWWTLRRPFRALSYHAAYRMFTRASATVGATWSPHDLRHSAAYRMARDPLMPLTDVQWVLGHAQLSTTQLYVSPLPEDVIANVLAFHRRATDPQPDPPPALRYRPESLNILFGTDR